jgi:DNA-binding CsgD family transcriptional regulator
MKKRKISTWKYEEIKYIEESYGTKPTKEIARILGRSVGSVRYKAHYIRNGKGTTVPYWSEAEIKYLEDNYGEKPAEEIAAKLNKDVRAVVAKANRMGMKHKARFTDAEIECVKTLYTNLPIGEIADKLGRSRGSIYSIICRLKKDGDIMIPTQPQK